MNAYETGGTCPPAAPEAGRSVAESGSLDYDAADMLRGWARPFALVSWVGLSLLPAVAFALPAGAAPRVTVDCPQLSAEARASLEARARTDLLVRQRSGSAVVVCRPPVVQVIWMAADGLTARLRGPVASDPRMTIERVLALLDELLTAPPEEAVIARPESSSPGAPAFDEADEPAAVGLRFGVEGAVELWSRQVLGVAGPGLSALLTLPRSLAVEAAGELLWTWRSSAGVRGRLWAGRLGGQYHFDETRRFRVGLAAIVGGLRAVRSGSEGALEATEILPAVALEGRYAAGEGRWSFVTGPSLRVYPSLPRVELGPEVPFRIPAVTARWTLGLELSVL